MRPLFGKEPNFVDTINGYKKSRLPLMWFVENIDDIYAEYRAKGVEFADRFEDAPLRFAGIRLLWISMAITFA